MKALCLLTSLLCFLIAPLSSAQTGAKYVAEDGMFSFSIPEGWTLREIPGRKYKVAFAAPENGFGANINIVDEAFSGALDAYVDGNLKIMAEGYEKVGFENFKVLGREAFTTTTKQAGIRLLTQSEANGNPIRQTFYFFNGKDGRKLVVTCTCPAAGGESYDPIFERSLKTFQSEPPAVNRT
ncbi:MAG TPA: hypothetical protein VKB46_08280 [Pyrinomonadaceae bacterium]|nr:hypothetical protein [Pyrinomonadaceae bacterium]